MATVFTRIINREIPADIVYEDDRVIAFRDIQPEAPVHIVIATKAPTPGLAATGDEGDHQGLLNAARRIAEAEGLVDGYRVVINQGPHGGRPSTTFMPTCSAGAKWVGRQAKWNRPDEPENQN